MTGIDASNAQVAVSVFGQYADRELATNHGTDIDEDAEPDPIAPMDRPRSGRETPNEKDRCVETFRDRHQRS